MGGPYHETMGPKCPGVRRAMVAAIAQFENDTPWQFVVDAIRILAMTQPHDAQPSDHVQEADSTLVASCLNGNDDSFGRIVDAYQATIALQMRRFSRDQVVQEELVHDVFVEAYMSLSSYRADSPLIHWLRKIAVRVGYRYWKRQSRNTEQTVQLSQVEESVERLATGVALTSDDASEVLASLLGALSARNRLVLTLLYWDGCSVAEAAELTGWSQTMIKVQAHRARKRLKKLIEESSQ